MPNDVATNCGHAELIGEYARDALAEAEQRHAERLLERNACCREHLRGLTRGKYPSVPNYTILAQIGAGGFGVVYKAAHHAKERIEALKVLFSKTPLLTSYFENEVHAIARLQHPNIATLYEAQLTNPPYFYTMEYVEGRRLNDYLRATNLTVRGRIALIREVADAVGYAHAQGVVHRDIKPQNILVDAAGQPHVVDFGIARRLGLDDALLDDADDAESGGPVGTVGYIAPEQRRGEEVDARADVFALGALLFHCVTGEPARMARDAERLKELLERREISRPADLAAIVARCVAEAPRERYATCTAFVDDLDRYVSGRSVAARSNPPWLARARRSTQYALRRHQIPLRVAVTVGVAALLTFLFWQSGADAMTSYDLGDQTAMIAVRPSTVRAVAAGATGVEGLSPRPDASWRRLHAALLRKLRHAPPKAVVFDYFFPKPAPLYDAEFAAAMRELREAAQCPVVVGARRFSVNGDPNIAEALADSVYGCGALYATNADLLEGELQAPYCVERGFVQPIPALALVGFAAGEYSDYALEVLVHRARALIELRYRKRSYSPRERRYLEASTFLPVHTFDRLAPGGRRMTATMESDDVVALARFKAQSKQYWAARTYPYETVLAAEPDQIKSWFAGRTILVGQMLPGVDEHPLQDGGTMFGCQIHAEFLDALLAKALFRKLDWQTVGWHALVWAALGALFVSARPARPWPALRGVFVSCGLIFIAALGLAAQAAFYAPALWISELALAISGLVASGSLVYLLKAVYEWQEQLAPPRQAAAFVAEPSTTVLADTAID